MALSNEQIAKTVLEAVGWKNNVTFVTHCMTRLRFNLKDMAIPDQEAMKELKGVLGVVVSGGQFQVVIGQNVPKVYAALCAEAGIAQQDAIDENLDGPKEKLTLKRAGSNILNYMAACMTPMIPAMMAAALFRTIQVAIGPDMLGWLRRKAAFICFATLCITHFFISCLFIWGIRLPRS